MGKGVNGCSIFIDDGDRFAFLNALERIIQQTGATVLAYCLMGNHFHLTIKVESVPLALIMHRLLTGYALTFNSRHDREGHLFQARYRAELCTDNSYLTALIRYVHMNPVRAGLTTRPEDWPWSSYRAYCAGGKDGLLPLESDLPDFNPWPTPRNGPILIRQIPETKQDLSSIVAMISTQTNISIDELRSGSRRRNVVAAKKRFVQAAVTGGHRIAAIAAWLSLTSSALTRYTREIPQISVSLTPGSG